MGPGANPGGGPMMQGPGGPGMTGGPGGYMGQQGYAEPSKGYMNQGMYGRTSGGYAGGPGGYTGRWVLIFMYSHEDVAFKMSAAAGTADELVCFDDIIISHPAVPHRGDDEIHYLATSAQS